MEDPGRSSPANGFAGFFIGLGSDRTRILQNTSQHDNRNGFDVHSNENVLIDNTAVDTPGNGFLIFQANNNTFTGNRAERCSGEGFTTTGSEHGNLYMGNVARNNGNDGQSQLPVAVSALEGPPHACERGGPTKIGPPLRAF